MALRPRHNPDIPGTSKEPAKCRKEVEGAKCGAPAHNWVEGSIKVMEKDVKVKLPVCDDHLSELNGGPYSVAN